MLFILPLLLGGSVIPAAPSSEPTVRVIQGDFEALKKQLRSDNDRDRRRAVEALAKLDLEDAWELIFETLEDPKAMIADAAQTVLGDTDSVDVVRELHTGKRGLRAKNDLTRARAVEAIGRVALPIEGHLLIKNLKSKLSLERRATCWSVERLCLADNAPSDVKGHLAKELKRLAGRDKDEEVRAAATIALAALQPDQRDELFQSARASKLPALQIAAMELSSPEQRTNTAFALAGSSSRAVRAAAVQTLERQAAEGDKEAVGHLIERLEQELNQRLSWRIVSKLQRLSGGRKTRRDAQAWRAWWEVAVDDWQPAEDPGEDFELDAGERSASFIGLPLLSQQMAFLVDFSGSIWKKRDGVTRKEKIDVEVQRALEGLPETAFFELIPFTADPSPWKGKLSPATKKKVKEAGDWFRSQKMNGPGDYLDAAEVALQIPDVDTQIFLGDGAPSGGERWDLNLIVPWLLEQNRFRQITFDIVLVDPGKSLIKYWERLAAATDGRVLVVDLKD